MNTKEVRWQMISTPRWQGIKELRKAAEAYLHCVPSLAHDAEQVERRGRLRAALLRLDEMEGK